MFVHFFDKFIFHQRLNFAGTPCIFNMYAFTPDIIYPQVWDIWSRVIIMGDEDEGGGGFFKRANCYASTRIRDRNNTWVPGWKKKEFGGVILHFLSTC